MATAVLNAPQSNPVSIWRPPHENPQSAEQRVENLSEWFWTLLERLQILRGISTDTVVATNILREIVRFHLDGRFTWSQAKAAEWWILCGDWSFKGVMARLELSDFFPTSKQLEGAIGYAVMTLPELHTKIRRAKEQGRVEGQLKEQKSSASPALTPEQIDHEKRLLEVTAERDEAQAELAKIHLRSGTERQLAEDNARMNDKIILLHNELEAMKRDVSVLTADVTVLLDLCDRQGLAPSSEFTKVATDIGWMKASR